MKNCPIIIILQMTVLENRGLQLFWLCRVLEAVAAGWWRGWSRKHAAFINAAVCTHSPTTSVARLQMGCGLAPGHGRGLGTPAFQKRAPVESCKTVRGIMFIMAVGLSRGMERDQTEVICEAFGEMIM